MITEFLIYNTRALQKENARAPVGEQWAAWDIWPDQLWYDWGVRGLS